MIWYPKLITIFFKTVPFCSPTEEDEACLKEMSQRKHGCLTSCSGLHADVRRLDESMLKMADALLSGTGKRFMYQFDYSIVILFSSGIFYWDEYF